MRRRVLSVGTALVLASAGVVVVAPSSGAAVGDVPNGCVVQTAAYRSDGQRLTYEFHGNTDAKTRLHAIPGDTLPWVPSGLSLFQDSGNNVQFDNVEFATHPTNGYLYRLERAGEMTEVGGVWRMTKVTATRIAPGFDNTRILVYALPYLYRVTGNSLYRYELNGDVPTNRVKLPGTAWDTVKTLIPERKGGANNEPVNVLMGTKSNGELKEWRIKWNWGGAPPTSIASTVLQPAGWGASTSLSTGSCWNNSYGRVLLAITGSGSASVYYDPSAKDWDGSDFVGGSFGALGWTAKAYGQ